jgi:hypothetical protein
MEAKEFRLGNVIKNKFNGIAEIVSISKNTIDTKALYKSSKFDKILSIKDVEGLKINKLALKKLGFTYQKQTGFYADEHHLVFENINKTFIFSPHCTMDIDCRIQVEFVHELQNAYYTNTKKKELKFKK